MTFAALALCLSIIAFALASAVGSAVAALLQRGFAHRIERMPARQRGAACFGLRLAPALGALLFVGLFFLPAFVLFEPHDTGETVSLAIVGLTFVAALPLARSAWAGLTAWRATRRRVARWLIDAEPLYPGTPSRHPAWVVQSAFPVVAVVGILRPFLIVSRAVLDTCTDDELAAILAHEATHVRRRDNLKRLLMLSAPDLLSGTAAARDLEASWQLAAEETADDGAGKRYSLHLASALVKVARLTEGMPAPPATMAAFCRGGEISHRVTRLIGARAPGESSRPGLLVTTASAVTTLALPLLASGAWRHLHALTEATVALLQ